MRRNQSPLHPDNIQILLLMYAVQCQSANHVRKAERFRAILGLPSRLTKAATFGVGSTPTPIQNEITLTLHEQIRRRAFELFEQRGREEGHELDDWLQAEEELTQLGNENDCRMMSPSGRTNHARAEQSRTFQGDASRTTKKRLILKRSFGCRRSTNARKYVRHFHPNIAKAGEQ